MSAAGYMDSCYNGTMKIRLDLEDVRFATTRLHHGNQMEVVGSIRWMVVRVGGKDFYVNRTMSGYGLYGGNISCEKSIDNHLIAVMELVMKRILEHGAEHIPEGVDIVEWAKGKP